MVHMLKYAPVGRTSPARGRLLGARGPDFILLETCCRMKSALSLLENKVHVYPQANQWVHIKNSKLRIPQIPATQSRGRLPRNPQESCPPVHVQAAPWTTGRLPPHPGDAGHPRSAATRDDTLGVCRGFAGQPAWRLAPGGSPPALLLGVGPQTHEEGLSAGRRPARLRPVLHGPLAGAKGGAALRTLFPQRQPVAPLCLPVRGEPPSIEAKPGRLGPRGPPLPLAPRPLGQAPLLQAPGPAAGAGGHACPAGGPSAPAPGFDAARGPRAPPVAAGAAPPAAGPPPGRARGCGEPPRGPGAGGAMRPSGGRLSAGAPCPAGDGPCGGRAGGAPPVGPWESRRRPGPAGGPPAAAGPRRRAQRPRARRLRGARRG
jgi:hypothetical protein